jgi:hypothetical protein
MRVSVCSHCLTQKWEHTHDVDSCQAVSLVPSHSRAAGLQQQASIGALAAKPFGCYTNKVQAHMPWPGDQTDRQHCNPTQRDEVGQPALLSRQATRLQLQSRCGLPTLQLQSHTKCMLVQQAALYIPSDLLAALNMASVSCHSRLLQDARHVLLYTLLTLHTRVDSELR